MRRAALFAFILMLGGCTDPQAAAKAIDDLGFTDFKATGYRWFFCGKDYLYHTGFSAKNPRGKIVTGAVCSGFIRGSAVKFD